MSKIKTITATTTEQAVTFDATYQFVWFRSMGDGDVLVSDHSGIVEGADDVALVKAGGSTRITVPYNKTVYVKAVSDSVDMEIHAQNFSDAPFKSKAKGGGQSITVEPLTVNNNGVYTAPTGKAYSPVSVDVQEQPWTPLQDGYSNFWFELTNDTLSPWLNFSAKNDNAVIDWGDGSGEVALNTLTPTHTYSKAGKYVVKVKGVTGIAQQLTAPFINSINILKAVELNSEITTLSAYSFRYCNALKNFVSDNLTSFGGSSLQNCSLLQEIEINSGVTTIPASFASSDMDLKQVTFSNTVTTISAAAFYFCISLPTVVFPSSITNIGNQAFQNCQSLSEIHVQSTNPPTLGTNVFYGVMSDFIIYVPVGTAETYKAASGWSTYANHILEEGQTPNRMMLAKFNSAKTDEPQDDMR